MMNSEDVTFYHESRTGDDTDQSVIVITRLNIPFGVMLAGATTKGICLLEFTDTHRVEMQLPRLEKIFNVRMIDGNSPFFHALNEQLQSYFKKSLKTFDVPLDIKGTSFQMKAWDALQTIPYGETRSYQQQAKLIDNPKAVRAVASANRNNRVSILIPCHRVIAKSGAMAGYGGGVWRKEYLLDLESGK